MKLQVKDTILEKVYYKVDLHFNSIETYCLIESPNLRTKTNIKEDYKNHYIIRLSTNGRVFVTGSSVYDLFETLEEAELFLLQHQLGEYDFSSLKGVLKFLKEEGRINLEFDKNINEDLVKRHIVSKLETVNL